MKIKENVTIFICDHCRKKYQIKSACEKHEPNCTKNPENIAACSGCDFLKETKTEVYFDGYYGEMSRNCKSFFCEKLNIGVYPHKVVRMGIIDKHPETFHEQKQMPTKCDHFSFNPGF